MKKTLAALMLLAACGNPIADDKYPGQPLITLQGTIGLASAQAVPANPTVGLVWYTSHAGGEQTPGGALQGIPTFVGEVAPVSATSFPASFDFQVFNPPPPSALFALGPDAGQLAGGYIVAVDDVNGDGAFTLTTQVVTTLCPFDGSFNGCTVPGIWVTEVGLSDVVVDAGVMQQSATVVTVAAPDRLLGVSGDFVLFYTPTSDGPAASGLSTVVGGSELAQPGYHLLNECQLPVPNCVGYCEDVTGQIVADSTPVDISPSGPSGASIPYCPTGGSGTGGNGGTGTTTTGGTGGGPGSAFCSTQASNDATEIADITPCLSSTSGTTGGTGGTSGGGVSCSSVMNGGACTTADEIELFDAAEVAQGCLASEGVCNGGVGAVAAWETGLAACENTATDGGTSFSLSSSCQAALATITTYP